MHEMMSLELAKQRREEIVREAEKNRLARALRAGRKTRGKHTFSLMWELRRIAGLLLKLSKRPTKGARP